MAKNKKNTVFVSLFSFVFLPLLALAISSLAIYKGVENYIATSNYFKVRELKIQGMMDTRYLEVMREEILGSNIFRINALNLSQRIRKKFPTFYSVTVTRVLPSQLLIVAKERLPVAILKRDLFYIVDTQGVALSSFASPEYLNFPLLVGLENRMPQVKLGAAGPMNVLARPLELAKILWLNKKDIEASMPFENRLKVTKIDAADLNNLSFYLGDDIQVKIGHQDYEGRVSLLVSILRSIGADLANIKYIDVRPREPVVATKDNKKKKP